MFFAGVIAIAHSWGASGSPDAVGGFLLGALFALWVAGWKKIK